MIHDNSNGRHFLPSPGDEGDDGRIVLIVSEMSQFLELTSQTGQPISIRVDAIESFSGDSTGTLINESIHVKESHESIEDWLMTAALERFEKMVVYGDGECDDD